ncbi:MAG: HIT family protein [Akkermansiaceae bacterium]
MENFQLNPRFVAGCFEIARKCGCRVLLKNEANFPWIIIVPEIAAEIEELHELEEARFAEVAGLTRNLSAFVDQYFSPDKVNIGCIGNQVRQLHIHIVGRFESDPAWPGVVWSFDGKKKYDSSDSDEIIGAAKRYLDGL